MSSSIHNLLAQPAQYAYSFITSSDLDPSDECFICKKPYNTADGCRAVKLTSCGHIICVTSMYKMHVGHSLTSYVYLVGLECFMEWVNRHPKRCPYSSHRLPENGTAHLPILGPADLIMAALRWICRTRWFRGIDSLVYHFPYFGLKAYTLMPGPFPDSWIVTSWPFHYYISAIVPISAPALFLLGIATGFTMKLEGSEPISVNLLVLGAYFAGLCSFVGYLAVVAGGVWVV
jgi:hypothetical protein